jgi:hypothetical protein
MLLCLTVAKAHRAAAGEAGDGLGTCGVLDRSAVGDTVSSALGQLLHIVFLHSCFVSENAISVHQKAILQRR